MVSPKEIPCLASPRLASPRLPTHPVLSVPSRPIPFPSCPIQNPAVSRPVQSPCSPHSHPCPLGMPPTHGPSTPMPTLVGPLSAEIRRVAGDVAQAWALHELPAVLPQALLGQKATMAQISDEPFRGAASAVCLLQAPCYLRRFETASGSAE